jgi:methionine sulfoxide reductase heme-binding subunit
MMTWVILRSAGIGAYLMVFLSVAWGLVATSGALGRQVSKASAVSLHQFLSTCGLLLLGIHVGGLLVDPFMPFGPSEILVPGAASYRPAATAFGVIAMYATVVVLVTSWIRKRIGTTWWRRIHLLAAPAFVVAGAWDLLRKRQHTTVDVVDVPRDGKRGRVPRRPSGAYRGATA